LAALGEDLASRNLRGDLYVVGGAAIALAYDERRPPAMSMPCSSLKARFTKQPSASPNA
jgi:hypothetical protein